MDKEKMLQLFAESLDKKASFNIQFSQYENSVPVINEAAQDLANRFAEALGGAEIKHHENIHANNYCVDVNRFRIVCCYIPGETEKSVARKRRIQALENELAQLKQEEEVM